MKGYDPSRVLYLPGRRLFGYWMLLKNIPGVLARVSSIFAGENINILKALVTSIEEDTDALFYCDFTDSEIDPKKFLEDLKGIKEVKDARVIEPIMSGLIIDNIHFPIVMTERRYLLIGEKEFRGFVKDMREKFGTVGEAYLYYIGLNVGDELWRKIDYYTTNVKDKIKIFKQLFMSSGYGKIDIEINVNREKADVVVYDSIECRQGIGSKKPYSHYIRGMIAGIFKNIFNGDVKVGEIKCIAVGDEYCDFKVEKKMPPLLPAPRHSS